MKCRRFLESNRFTGVLEDQTFNATNSSLVKVCKSSSQNGSQRPEANENQRLGTIYATICQYRSNKMIMAPLRRKHLDILKPC